MYVKLNGNRKVTGILRGFDPFLNVVLEDTVEESVNREKQNIGMVVCGFLRPCFLMTFRVAWPSP